MEVLTITHNLCFRANPVLLYVSGCKGVFTKRICYSGGSRGGSGGSPEPPFEAKLFYFHGDLFEMLGKTNQTNPPLQI